MLPLPEWVTEALHEVEDVGSIGDDGKGNVTVYDCAGEYLGSIDSASRTFVPVRAA